MDNAGFDYYCVNMQAGATMNTKRIMEVRHLLISIICLVYFLSDAYASVASHNMFLTGLHLACNQRYGYYDFSGDHQFREKPVPVISPGIDFGKRFHLTKLLFISATFSLNEGFTKEIVPYSFVVDDVDGIRCDLYKNYLQTGISSLLHVQIPFSLKNSELSFAAGGGVYYSRYKEQLREHSGQKLWLYDSYFLTQSKVTGCLDAGVFCELPFLIKSRLCFSYNFRYWKPVSYTVARDLFPVKSIKYQERFFTQWLGVCSLYGSPF
jgi:hypothetical protein